MPFRRVFYPDFVLPPEGGGGFASLVSSLSPTSWWRLGESSGTTAVDEQGLNNGIYTGSITLGSTGLVSGDSDTAITLTASGAYVDVTAASTVYADLTGGFSVLAITDLASIPASSFASICRLKSSSSAPFGLAYSNAASYTDISFGLLPSTSRRAIATITGPTMLLVTYNGTAYSVYVNGSLVANIAGGSSMWWVTVPLSSDMRIIYAYPAATAKSIASVELSTVPDHTAISSSTPLKNCVVALMLPSIVLFVTPL
jgi:hypothetical protein